MIVYKKTDEWYIKRQTSDNEWQQVEQPVATNDNELHNEWQRVTMSDTTSDNEWQRMTRSGTTNGNKWKRMRASKGEWFWFQNEPKYAMYNYNIFSNIDYL